MMPVMNGIDLCTHIKSNPDICHIPVVMLTALYTTEHHLEGLQQGADDYIAKPFNVKLLLTRCNNLVRNRLIMQNRLKKETDFGVELLATNPLDKQLLDRVTEIIDEHAGKPDFDMNRLARLLCMSRSSFFVKFKELTGLTPNDFIQIRQLNKAADLLRNRPDMQVVEISDTLGFNSPDYFSRCFKARFGISPNQFRKHPSDC
jgi:AraC-like DNA-binding protein